MHNRRHFLKLAALAALPALSATAKVHWQQKSALPIRIQELYACVFQSGIVVAGGIAVKLGVPYFSSHCYHYLARQNQWQRLPDLPNAKHHAALATLDDKLFQVGGFNGAYNHIWKMTNQVLQLQGKQWRASSALPVAQAEGVVATSPDNAIHIVSGQSPKGEANKRRSDHVEVHTHLRLDSSNGQWQKLAPIPTARNSATGGWLGDKLIVTGGRTAAGNLADTEIYDLTTDSWTIARPMPLAQAGSGSVVVEGGLLVFGGEQFIPQAKVFANVWYYSIHTDQWTEVLPMANPRHGLAAARLGDNIYTIGGATHPGGKGTSDLNEVISWSQLCQTYSLDV